MNSFANKEAMNNKESIIDQEISNSADKQQQAA